MERKSFFLKGCICIKNNILIIIGYNDTKILSLTN